jgi:hypothetical protein
VTERLRRHVLMILVWVKSIHYQSPTQKDSFFLFLCPSELPSLHWYVTFQSIRKCSVALTSRSRWTGFTPDDTKPVQSYSLCNQKEGLQMWYKRAACISLPIIRNFLVCVFVCVCVCGGGGGLSARRTWARCHARSSEIQTCEFRTLLCSHKYSSKLRSCI